MTAAYGVKDSPLRPPVVWRLEDGDLVRAGPGGESRWPLAGLTRMTLQRQVNRYGPDVRLAQLRFGRRAVAFSSQGWSGVGRRQDQSPAFAAFVRALAAEAVRQAPAARFQVGGRGSAPAALYWTAALLGTAVAALMASALMSGFVAIGLDWGARLLFVLILMFAVAPWLPGRSANAFDPLAPPEDLAPRG